MFDEGDFEAQTGVKREEEDEGEEVRFGYKGEESTGDVSASFI